jgi:hypothetical protein
MLTSPRLPRTQGRSQSRFYSKTMLPGVEFLHTSRASSSVSAPPAHEMSSFISRSGYCAGNGRRSGWEAETFEYLANRPGRTNRAENPHAAVTLQAFKDLKGENLASVPVWEHKGKPGRQGRKSRDYSGQVANCRSGIGFSAAESPAISCLPRVMRLPLEIAQVLGRTSTGPTPGQHPDGSLATLGIIAESGFGRPTEQGVRKDRSPCSARFPDGGGCGQQPVGL